MITVLKNSTVNRIKWFRAEYFIFCLICVLLADCKKPETVNYKIFGTITNSRSGAALEGANVELSAQVLTSGTFNNSYEFQESTFTDASGRFEINVEKAAFNSLKVNFDKSFYFSDEEIFNPESIDPQTGINVSMELDPVAFVDLTLRNISPINSEDQLDFRYISAYFPDCICCNNDYQQFYGTDIDTTISCAIVGETQLDYLYSVFKGGGISNLQGGQYIESFTTTEIEINY